jgi:hypothetical protein
MIERLACDDVRGVFAYGAHPLVDTMLLDGDHVRIEARWVESRSRRPTTGAPAVAA